MSNDRVEASVEAVATEPQYVDNIWKAITPEYLKLASGTGAITPAQCIANAELSRIFDQLVVNGLVDETIITAYLDDVQNKGMDYALAITLNPLLSVFIDFKKEELTQQFIEKLTPETYMNLIATRKESLSEYNDAQIKKDLAQQIFFAVKNILNNIVLSSRSNDPRVFFESTLMGTFDQKLQLERKLSLFEENAYQFTYDHAKQIEQFFLDQGHELVATKVLTKDELYRFNVDDFQDKLNVFFPLDKTDDLYGQFFFQNLCLTQAKLQQKLSEPNLSGTNASKLQNVNISIEKLRDVMLTPPDGLNTGQSGKTLKFLTLEIKKETDVSPELANLFSSAIDMLPKLSDAKLKTYQELLGNEELLKQFGENVFEVKFYALVKLALLSSNTANSEDFYSQTDCLIRFKENKELLFLFEQLKEGRDQQTLFNALKKDYQQWLTLDSRVREKPEEQAQFNQDIIAKYLNPSASGKENIQFSSYFKFLKNYRVGKLDFFKATYEAHTQINRINSTNEEDTKQKIQEIYSELEKKLLDHSLDNSYNNDARILELFEKFQDSIPQDEIRSKVIQALKDLIDNGSSVDISDEKYTSLYLEMSIQADIAKQKYLRIAGIVTLIATGLVVTSISVLTFGAGLTLIPLIYGVIAAAVASIFGIGGGFLMRSKYQNLSQRIVGNKEQLEKIKLHFSPAQTPLKAEEKQRTSSEGSTTEESITSSTQSRLFSDGSSSPISNTSSEEEEEEPLRRRPHSI